MSIEELDTWIPVVSLMRLAVAVAAAALIGWERESLHKPAGLRTHMMVSLGAATFVLASVELGQQSAVKIDPTRVVAGIVGGVGFLGAGTIIRSHGDIEGITTAASVWVAAGIGTAAGLGMYRIVACVSILSLFILGFLRVVQARLTDKTTPSNTESD